MKFETLRARVLYTRAPADEEVGSTTEGVGWAGLYLRWEGVGGFILNEDVQGFVTIMECPTDEILQEEWGRVCEALEIGGAPDHGDPVILENERTGEYFSVLLGESEKFEDIGDIIERMMEENMIGDGKTLWLLNCRGNFIPINPEEYVG